jgi:hypothetical protein
MKGSFSEEALLQYSELIAQKDSLDFIEGDTYDFTRCVRPDGSSYGTGGKCRKGSEAAKEEAEKVKRQVATAEKGKAAAREFGHNNKVREDTVNKGAKALSDGNPKLEKSIRSRIESKFDSATPEDRERMIRGDWKALLEESKSRAKKDPDEYVKEEAKRGRAEAIAVNKEAFKDKLTSGDPNVRRKAKEDMKFYVERQVERIKSRARDQWRADFSLVRSLQMANQPG